MSVGRPGHGDLLVRSPRLRAWGAREHVSATALAIACLTGLGAALRFYGLGRQGFWFDEANTAQLVGFSPGKMLGLIPQSESTPPLYYCVAWIWARLFGANEPGLRSLSALAGVIVVPVAYGAASKLVCHRAGVICAALAAANPFLIWYSQEARSYELLVLTTGVALLAFAHARVAPHSRPLAVWVLSSAVALATHYYAIVAIVPQAAWLMIEHRQRRSMRVAVGIVCVCGLALVPLAISQNGTGHDGWIASAPLGPRLRQIVPQFLIGTGSPERHLLEYLAMAAAAVALVLLATRAGAGQQRGALTAGGLAAAGLLLGLLLTGIGFDDLITRNVIALWLPAAVLLSGGLAAQRARVAGITATVVLCAIGIVATAGIAADPGLQRPDWRRVARALGPAPGGSRAILIQHYRDVLPLSLYVPRLHAFGRGPATVTSMDVVSMTSPQQPLCWWGAACNLLPSRMQASYDVPGFHEIWRRRTRQFTIMALVAGHPVRLTRAAVAGALLTTRLPHDALLLQRTRAL